MGSKKAIIIGGGLGGLAVALRLAARRWKVTVFEQGDSFGGKMNRWDQGGYRFDTGPSLVTMPGVFEELFKVACADLRDHLELMPIDPLARYVFDDGFEFQVTASLPEWLSTLKAIEPRGDRQFLRFMHLGSRLFELSRQTFFKRPPSELPDLQSLMALRHLPLRHGWGNYHRTIAAFFQSPYLRQMYDRFPTYVGSSPYRIPATLSLIPYLEHAFGGWYVRGGLYRIISALVELAIKRGVNMASGRRVCRIQAPGRQVQGVTLEDGSSHPCDIAVMNGDSSMARILLKEEGARPLPEPERSLSGFILLIGLKRRLPEVGHHTVYFSADYPREFADLFVRRVFPEDPTVYVSIPSRSDRSMAPTDGETLFMMANAPANDADPWGEQEITEARRRVFERLRKSGFPEIEEDIAVSSIWTPRRMAEAYDMPGGAIYGPHSHGWSHAFFAHPTGTSAAGDSITWAAAPTPAAAPRQ
ncbi:MAG: phytoene desaturase [Rhodospirillales bacterium]|nr:phytoene desaturase [Rhodospirillales bacterium]